MKAIVYHEYGGPEVLRLEEVEEPHAGPGQVRLKIVTVGVNPFDYKVRRGWMQQFIPQPFPVIPGTEAAGIVDEVGEGVSGVSVGDEVLGATVTMSEYRSKARNDRLRGGTRDIASSGGPGPERRPRQDVAARLPDRGNPAGL